MAIRATVSGAEQRPAAVSPGCDAISGCKRRAADSHRGCKAAWSVLAPTPGGRPIPQIATAEFAGRIGYSSASRPTRAVEPLTAARHLRPGSTAFVVIDGWRGGVSDLPPVPSAKATRVPPGCCYMLVAIGGEIYLNSTSTSLRDVGERPGQTAALGCRARVLTVPADRRIRGWAEPLPFFIIVLVLVVVLVVVLAASICQSRVVLSMVAA